MNFETLLNGDLERLVPVSLQNDKQVVRKIAEADLDALGPDVLAFCEQ